jgi:L-alanine-DL-glutamate epimerase-like enolase superfamily enzyme
MMGGITESLRVATIAEHYGLAVAPHFLPALYVHLAAAAPAVRWLEHFPLLEPLFDRPADLDANGEIAPRETPGHGLAWAPGARETFRIAA